MNGVVARRRTSMSLKERLGLRGLGCCGATWGFKPTTISVISDEEEALEQEREEIEVVNAGSNPTEGVSDPGCPAVTSIPASSGMNLAAALAAERQFREASIIGPSTNNVEAITAAGTPLRVSLMRLLEEADGGDGEVGAENEKGAVGSDTVCCVCMARKKGAAFIPCGHTYCRVCSRELWLNRGSCPLCNRSILEILDIF
ncbi:hypothetical protein P3X46_033485 [Hevea brasiliensis]|uniref:RING-type domain-containing protein n=1 Tax=Hevea brasiliensis TaxID=3981 RepID=A0ABQ9KGJ9_HEVBR|nr:uncharacterized protein LOC110656688 [Hevea brasiliensis]XP_021669278.1 uncharacterized protein LOC110656688 [Hevea brasiliensis]KAJ9136402.1 hypothetical protein P3X46_033485 [Hevea brasiliensis]